MIIAIVIAVYVAGAVAVGRWTSIRRLADQGGWGEPDEDDCIAIALSASLWPLASFFYLVTRPPKPTKQQQIEKLERELGI